MKTTNTVNRTKRVKMMKRRRKFFSGILAIALLATASSALWAKAHKTYICDINYVNDCIIYVVHPNGQEYGVQVDSKEEYQNLLKAKVTFNELTDWEKNYTISNITPYEEGGELIVNQ